jgi:hypothetical protein
MRRTLNIIILFICVSISSNAQYGFLPDSINRINCSGRYGYWIVFGENKINSSYQPNQKVEEGFYENDKKVGAWKYYFCSGNIKSVVNFLNGQPIGNVVVYHENGKVAEEGEWQDNHWVGKYCFYTKDGSLMREYFFGEKIKKSDNTNTKEPTFLPKDWYYEKIKYPDEKIEF